MDVEDWSQLELMGGREVSDRFEGNVMQVLDALATHELHGTFFVLGLTAEKAHGPIQAIAAAGHEVQSHGYSHRKVSEMTEEEFRQDLLKARGIIEDVCGQRVDGYRAPCFTINEKNIWALDVLAETGHAYDSSIFPVKTSSYGTNSYPPWPTVVTTRSGRQIVEAPVACFHWLRRRWPIGGGGYFRLWPYWIIRKAWRQLEREGRPGIVYLHPHEFDAGAMSLLRDRVTWMRRMHQGLGRKGLPGKIDRLLSEFEFTSMRDVLADLLKTTP